MFKIFAPLLKASMGPDGKMRLHGIASSTVTDRHGDTMTASALSDMERAANNNLTIFLNHEYRVPEDVAGSVERAIIRSHPQDQNIHDLSLDIVINQSNDRAVKAWEAINAGTQLGLSIGAMIPEGGAQRDRKTGAYSIDHVDLLETSLVGVPANPRSWVEYAVKSLTGIEKQFEEEDLTAEEVEDQIEADAEIPEQTSVLEEILVAEGAELVPAIDTEMTEEAVEERLGNTDPEPDAVYSEPNTATFNDTNYTLITTDNTNPTITDATVSISTPYADINIDTGNRGGKSTPSDGTSQEAPPSAPENEETDEDETLNPWAAIGLSGEPEVEEIEPALQILEPTVVASLRTSSDLLKAITRELIDTKKALDDALLERDAAIEATEKVLANTAQILARLSATPVGRRATVRQATEQFESLKAVYGDDFLTLLKKG
jgi:HK97 family phage prohead protease